MNELERRLARAADDPASRPAFYRALMDSTVFVIGFTDAGDAAATAIPAGAKLSIVSWRKEDGTPVVPFFTSVDALRRVLTEETAYVALPARSLFETTLGDCLVLNPESPYGKEFLPDEVKAMLGTGMNHAAQPRVVAEGTEVQLGPPARQPSRMMGALQSLLARHPAVKAAYLCLMHDASAGDRPSLVVGLHGDSDMRDAIREAGAVAADTAPDGEIVDLVALSEGEPGISDYMFRFVTPFYKRSWAGTLRSLLR